MNKTFELNGVTYIAKAFDFNIICDLEDMGVSLQDAQKKPMGLIRAYIAICMGGTIEEAGKVMEQHIINGGAFDEVMGVIAEEMNKSDFFQSITKGTKKKTTKA